MLLGIVGAAFLTTGMAVAADQVSHSTLRLKVGQTGRVGTFGGHRSDCITSVPAEIRIVTPPTRGTVSQRENVPYTAKNSISGTCLGENFMGTSVYYTASSSGSDILVLEAQFANGVARRTVSITNR